MYKFQRNWHFPHFKEVWKYSQKNRLIEHIFCSKRSYDKITMKEKNKLKTRLILRCTLLHQKCTVYSHYALHFQLWRQSSRLFWFPGTRCTESSSFSNLRDTERGDKVVKSQIYYCLNPRYKGNAWDIEADSKIRIKIWPLENEDPRKLRYMVRFFNEKKGANVSYFVSQPTFNL